MSKLLVPFCAFNYVIITCIKCSTIYLDLNEYNPYSDHLSYLWTNIEISISQAYYHVNVQFHFIFSTWTRIAINAFGQICFQLILSFNWYEFRSYCFYFVVFWGLKKNDLRFNKFVLGVFGRNDEMNWCGFF